MNNEEKILDILATMQGEISAVRGDLTTMQGDISTLRSEIVKTNNYIENVMEPKIDALAEGHKAILERLVPRTRVDDMEEEIKLLKLVVRQMGDELQKLKMAQ